MRRTTLSATPFAVALAAMLVPAAAQAQGMAAASGGLVNRAVARLGGLEGLGDAGPGWLYLGFNGADRGLGYNGSYLTLGGFIPAAEDDLGGFWAADLRGHISQYGGFFSNVGAVRKQFIGGTLLGVGVYWDYDGDLDQYPTLNAPGTAQFGQFGHTYNQVGVSGEWLTNIGNLRTNGYMPVRTTGYTIGSPGVPFYGNYLLCQEGLDAALGGADLEVGLYLPGLADWAGMLSVGGYALGNTDVKWLDGPQAGQGVVPTFGGVYTRLDFTFLRNWDLSLQYNNDSYFESTGFARITYRMGGSRRRNVPDQMEQPMMRNEHIVRAHETPVVATNPGTGQAWNVIHVDNTALIGGSGSYEAPVQTLAQAQALAVNPYDIVFVNTGTGTYDSMWQFQADNQLLVGAGSTLELATESCGFRQFFNTVPAGSHPVLTSTSTAIELRNGAVVDHFQIQNAPVGIAAGPTLTAGANVNDVRITGTNATGQVGIQLANVPGGQQLRFLDMLVQDTGRGLWINGGAPNVNFQGTIASTASAGESVLIQNVAGGAAGAIVNVNATNDTLGPDTLGDVAGLVRNSFFTQPFLVSSSNATVAAPINVSLNSDLAATIGPTIITTPTQRGVAVQNNTSSQIAFRDLNVTDATDEAFIAQGNDAASTVSILGSSSLSSASTTLPVFDSNDDATLAITLRSLTSAIPSPQPPAAISLQGTSTGVFSITESFTVGGVPGTAVDNVLNTTPVIFSGP